MELSKYYTKQYYMYIQEFTSNTLAEQPLENLNKLLHYGCLLNWDTQIKDSQTEH